MLTVYDPSTSPRGQWAGLWEAPISQPLHRGGMDLDKDPRITGTCSALPQWEASDTPFPSPDLNFPLCAMSEWNQKTVCTAPSPLLCHKPPELREALRVPDWHPCSRPCCGHHPSTPLGHSSRAAGPPAARTHATAFCFCWHNVCPVLPPQSLNPGRSAELEIVLNEKSLGFICFLLQPLSPPVYRHAVTSDNNAQRQQMLMSFLCSPHNKSIKTTSENYEPP